MCTLVNVVHHHTCQRDVSVHHGRWLSVNDKADISADKEAGNWKYYVFALVLALEWGGHHLELHDGAGEAAALFQQGETRLGEG